MTPLTMSEAITITDDLTRSTLEREEAIHYLAENPTSEGVQHLVDAMEDEQFSIRWAAARALTYTGRAALAPVLRKLIAKGSSASLREVAHHALHKNVDPQVRASSRPVLEAMKGPAADLATPQAAYQLLRELQL